MQNNKENVVANLYDKATRCTDYTIWRFNERRQCYELLSKENVDGGLIGGAALKAKILQ
jgi:hypothetical protein